MPHEFPLVTGPVPVTGSAPSHAQVLPDGSQWAWIVEWARTSEASLAAYDVSEYDTAVYDGAADLEWNDASGFALSLSTRSGKDRFLKRYRTSSGRLSLDNSNGRWAAPGAGFRPGDFVRLSVRVTPSDVSPPIDDPLDGDTLATKFLLNAGTGIDTGMEAPLPAAPSGGYKVTVTNAITAVTHTSDQPLVSAYSGNASNRLFQIEQRTDDTIRAVMSHDTTATQSMTAPGTYPPGTLLNIELVVDYAIPEATLTVNGQTTTLALTATGPNTTVAPFTIGRRALSQQAGLFWRGTMEQAAMLTLSDVPLVTADFSDPGLVGSLDGVNWIDSQGNTWSGLIGSATEGAFFPTTWDDETGREWTAHGDLILTTPAVLAVDYRRFYGRVDNLSFKVKGGQDSISVNVFGLFADWAVIDLEGVPAEGAGDTTQERMNRIFDAAGFDFSTVTEFGVPVNTMQATTLAQPMLQTAQITMDSEGGDFMEVGDGTFSIGYQDWLIEAPDSTAIQYAFGGQGIGMIDATPLATIQVLVNDATFAVIGGTNQSAIDAASIARYGHRTTRRLDLIAEGDAAAQTLATRAVNQLAAVRLRVNQLDIDIDDFDAATMGGEIKFGDLVLVVVESIFGWAAAFTSHIVGISHTSSETTWRVSLTLDDAFVDNVDGAFYFESHSTSFSLGGQP